MFINKRQNQNKQRELAITKKINSVLKCQNQLCNREYVRLYELLEHLKKGISYGDKKYVLIHSEENDIIEEWSRSHNIGGQIWSEIKNKHMHCPDCGKFMIKAEDYDWIYNIEEPPAITLLEWKNQREDFKQILISLNNQLDEFENNFKQYKEVHSFQSYYNLNSLSTRKTDNSFSSIVNQLEIMVNYSPYITVAARAFWVLEDVKKFFDSQGTKL